MINKIYEINETDRLYPKKLLQIKDRPNKIYVVIVFFYNHINQLC